MKHILVAYDGTDPARKALGTAMELAKALGAEVAVISVVPVHRGWTSINPCDDQTIHLAELCEAQEILRTGGQGAKLLERTGEPAETIEAVAEEGAYDMIVVGSRSPGSPAAGYMGNSVSEHVAANARMTVVVAR